MEQAACEKEGTKKSCEKSCQLDHDGACYFQTLHVSLYGSGPCLIPLKKCSPQDYKTDCQG